MSAEQPGTLEVDVLNAKVIWRLGLDNFDVGMGRIVRIADFLDLQFRIIFYPGGDSFRFKCPGCIFIPTDPSLQVNVFLSGYPSHPPSSFPTDTQTPSATFHTWPELKMGKVDVEILIDFVKLNGVRMRDALPGLLAGALEKEKDSRAAAESEAKDLRTEVDGYRALIVSGNDKAAIARSGVVRAAVVIQAKWRQMLSQRQLGKERAYTAWQSREASFVAAVSCLQSRWRLKKKKRERRWLREQGGGSSAETPYDAILAFDSLSEFLEEGKIEFLQKAHSHLEILKESRYRIVAVVGLFDKGKTWLLNKLFGVNLPSGKLYTTKGLSFLWIKERRMLVLDSAGVQSTVSYRAQAVDAIHDAQTTESLMFEMVSRISHHMVFVVNDLTWFEQKYVAMLHQKYVQCKQHKELIVVHNLRNTSDVAEAVKLFKRQVMQCYDGEPSHLGRLIFTADLGEGVPPVHHVGLCNEFSPAGDEFNSKNREYLLQGLEHGNTLGSNVVLSVLLSRELSRLLPKFVNIETTEPEASDAAPEQAVSVIFEAAETDAPEVNDNGYASSGIFSMRLSHENARVTTKTRGVISPLGEIIAHDVSFDPIVNVYDKAVDTGVHRFIRIECPGVVEEEIEWEELPNGVKVCIDKKPPIQEHAVQPVEPIRQHHGAWERDFSFDHSDGRFELCEDESALENGVLTIMLKKALQPRKGRLGKARARRSEAYGQGRVVSPPASDCGTVLVMSDVASEAAGKLF